MIHNICQICGKEYKSIQSLSKHLNKHNIDKQAYYDMYFKKPNESICKCCGKRTYFHGMGKGYNKYCSKHCQVSFEAIQTNIAKNNRYIELRQQYERNYNCTQKSKLYSKYGQRVLDELKLPQIYKYECNFISNSYIPVIEDYVKSKHLLNTSGTSNLENKIATSIKMPIIRNSKAIIHPYELDIYIPDSKIAIEVNGTYYHSNKRKPIDYHLKKSLLCRDRGIRLIHIYEFEDIDEQIYLLNELLNGNDLYPKNDFNKNNFLEQIPEPTIVYQSDRLTVYGAGPLVKEGSYED